MEEYIVSARKYRPATFDSVVGQRSLTTTLLNAIRTGKLAHAYLFCGPRGVGKTTCARIFAKTLNCMNPKANGEACNECESCKAFDEQRSMNIHELDAASNNSVDDIRNLIEQTQIPPQVGKYKVFIIDEVHMLSSSAFNAFLKTLEEPPHYCIFILATTEKHKILPTILSRCQVYDFARMTIQNTVEHLAYVAQKEGYTAEPEALNLIAQKADGGMRDALSIFDQMVSFTGGNITYQRTLDNLNVLDTEYYFRLVDHFLKGEVEPSMLLFNEVLQKGFDGGNFIAGLASHLRNLLVSRDASTLPLLEVSDQQRQKYQEQAQRCKARFLYRAIKLCNDCDLGYRTSRNKRLQVEICLIQCAQASAEDEVGSGRRPAKILKPIFKQLAAEMTVQAASAARTQSAPAAASAPAQKPADNPSKTTTSDFKADEHPNPFAGLQNSPTKHVKLTREELGLGTITKKPEAEKAPQPRVANIQVDDKGTLTARNLTQSWLSFANNLGRDDMAVAQRMKSIQPQIIGENDFEVVVLNDQINLYFTELRPRIIAFMQELIGVTGLQMTIRTEEVKVAERIFDKKELHRRMLKKNPYLKKLEDALKLKLE